MVKKRKKPKISFVPKVEKSPKIAESKNTGLTWKFNRMDWNGPFRWDDSALNRELFDKLGSFEVMDIPSLQRSGSHEIKVEKLSALAISRLKALKSDDLESLFSVRLAGKLRVFTIKSGNRLSLLWYDPEHEVCESKLKNT